MQNLYAVMFTDTAEQQQGCHLYAFLWKWTEFIIIICRWQTLTLSLIKDDSIECFMLSCMQSMQWEDDLLPTQQAPRLL